MAYRKHLSQKQQAAAQKGYTLVELMVSLAVGVMVMGAAAAAYLSISESQRSLTEKSYAAESARFAMETLGREIQNSGFYPVNEVTPLTPQSALPIGSFATAAESNPATSPEHLRSPVFGCSSKKIDATKTTSVCVAHTSSSPAVDADTLVASYYTDDDFGKDRGNNTDCARATPAAVTGSNVKLFFISNSYTLTPVTLKLEGNTIKTFGLACAGSASPINNYVPLITGIEQLRLSYLVQGETTAQFKSANSVLANEWSKVIAVKVCLVARSLQNVRLQASSYSFKDCADATQTFATGIERKRYTQIFAVKNATLATP
ncbi:MAG: prepilin-type N-terminal cleavage/methylation domain-containing protein [Comamonadaceae bacterium]|jgi:type IV pilus assembly protein PilW|nr:MAG: prepilin-type N-terminal cleavage/methylation domain-containing protein [Comamonadaceae bacterium]